MSLFAGNRIQETTTTSGLGTLTLNGPAAQAQGFSSGVGTGNQCSYTVLDGNGSAWFSAVGTVTVSGGITTLSRDTIFDGSNGVGANVNLSVGTHTVYVDLAAQLTPALIPIKKIVVASPVNNVTFSSIPQYFTHLYLLQDARVTDNVIRQDIAVQINGDSSANYDRIWQQSTGATGGGGSVSGGSTVAWTSFQYAWTCGATAIAGESTTSELLIFNYAGTTFQKKMRASTNNFSSTGFADFFVQYFSGHWRNTAAVTSLNIFDTGGGNIVAGSMFSLYGIM